MFRIVKGDAFVDHDGNLFDFIFQRMTQGAITMDFESKFIQRLDDGFHFSLEVTSCGRGCVVDWLIYRKS